MKNTNNKNKLLMASLGCLCLAFCLSCSNSTEKLKSKIVLYRHELHHKDAVFPGGNDSMRVFFAENIKYNAMLDTMSKPYIRISYTVNPDCGITINDSLLRIETRYLRQSKAIQYMKKEASRVVRLLHYDQPSMEYNADSGKWIPSSASFSKIIYFERNPIEACYDKNRIIDYLDHSSPSFRLSFFDVEPGSLIDKRFRHITSDQEKIQLLNEKHSAVLELNAIIGLLESGNPAYKDYLPKIMADTSLILLFDGECEVWNKTAYECLQMTVGRMDVSKIDYDYIDSVSIFHSGSFLNYNRTTPKESYYPIVRQICEKGEDPDVLYLLAKYQKPEDRSLIIDILKKYNYKDSLSSSEMISINIALEIIADHPDNEYVKELEYAVRREPRAFFWYEDKVSIMLALFAYDNDWAYNQALKMCNSISSEDLKFLCFYRVVHYLDNHPVSRFADLFEIINCPN